MKREIITTADGSKTIQLVDWNEQYHSKHGAIQEAYHVFIKSGLELYKNQQLALLEIGFGTGLNALITHLEAPKLNLNIHYTGVEAYPVSSKEIKELEYCKALDEFILVEDFEKMHASAWERDTAISKSFTLRKQQKKIADIDEVNAFDLIYFDAFGARVQPELWTESIFKIMYASLKNQGVLVTYSAKGSVRRAMQDVGFEVERLPGPPGKREMLRARKNS